MEWMGGEGEARQLMCVSIKSIEAGPGVAPALPGLVPRRRQVPPIQWQLAGACVRDTPRSESIASW
jgi:hypothetical protein